MADVRSELRAGLASLLTNTRVVGTCCESLVRRDVHRVLPLTKVCDGKRKGNKFNHITKSLLNLKYLKGFG